MHRLTFLLASLEPILSGSKTCTIRFSAVAKRINVGDLLKLAFGAYNRPTVLVAEAVRVERFDLTEQLEQMHAVDAELDNLTEQDKADMDAVALVMETWTSEDHRNFLIEDGAPAELLDALDAAGGDYDGVLLETEARGLSICTAIWWQGVRRGD